MTPIFTASSIVDIVGLRRGPYRGAVDAKSGMTRVRIGVDGYNLAMSSGTGVATYATELVSTLHRLGHQVEGVFGIDVPVDVGARQTAFFDAYRRQPGVRQKGGRWRAPWQYSKRYIRAFSPHRLREIPLDANVTKPQDGTASLPGFDRLLSASHLFDDALFAFAQTGRITTIKLFKPPEIMHWTYPVPVRMADSRNIYTLHDIVPLKLPYTTLDDKRLYRALISACLRHATQICTVSDASKRDIINQFDADPERITNTYQASTEALAMCEDSEADDARSVESLFGLPRKGYFLYFGAIEPKKNVGRLIEAYLTLRSSTPLVIIGARSWQSEDELRLMPDGGTAGMAGTFRGPRGQTIIRLDYMPRPLLAKLVRGARAVVFPSLYEGFGLPILEAMQIGTPVITSNISSLPEIAGTAGLLVDPYDVAALTEAMRRVDSDAALRVQMSARGLKQAQLFSGDRYQVRLTELYNAALRRTAI